MSHSENNDHTKLMLPPSVVSKLDVSRLVAEVELIDNAMTSADVRARAGVTDQQESGTSEQMSDFLNINNLAIGDSHQRSQLISDLRKLKDDLPVIHMTFAAPADHESLQQVVAWLRESVHPLAVISVGLQPGLVGGAYIRTSNQVHDLSLRAQLASHRDVLIQSVKKLGEEAPGV